MSAIGPVHGEQIIKLVKAADWWMKEIIVGFRLLKYDQNYLNISFKI